MFSTDLYQRWFPNFGTGVLYYTEAFFVGLSVPELLAIPHENESIGTIKLDEYRYILSGAYLFDISKTFRLKPSVMIDYNKAFTSYRASLNIGLMDSRVFVGGAYDFDSYITALLNIKVNPQWMIGYAYMMNTGRVTQALGGSHEVVLRWEFRPIIRTIPDDPFYF
jgi:type IX secretion system PorP/SprF family membrane protein